MRRRNPAQRGRTAFILAFLSPAVLIYGAFVVLPLIQAFGLSMYRWRGVSAQKRYVGLGNFDKLIHDDVFWKALKNNLWLMVVAGLAIMVLSLVIAHAMQGSGRIGRSLRSVYLLPQMISLVVVAVLWQFLYHPTIGPVTSILKAVGLEQLSKQILGDPSAAMPAIAVSFVWFSVGFYIMLFAAGLQSLPKEVVEAAELDGSTGFHRFRSITWPMLWSIKRIAVIYIVINVMNVFALVYLMTKGGPDRATETMLTYLYQQAFDTYEVGYATALAVANFIVAMVLAGVVGLALRRDPQEARR
ncbi:MAG: carbohydrate ABC transporter permease [Fimbriimonas sp.]